MFAYVIILIKHFYNHKIFMLVKIGHFYYKTKLQALPNNWKGKLFINLLLTYFENINNYVKNIEILMYETCAFV